MQFRGGPPGFLRVLDERTLGWADFRGNRRYVSVGNAGGDDRVVLVHIAGFDWNCPQHITPRFSLEEIEMAVTPLRQRVAELEVKLAG